MLWRAAAGLRQATLLATARRVLDAWRLRSAAELRAVRAATAGRRRAAVRALGRAAERARAGRALRYAATVQCRGGALRRWRLAAAMQRCRGARALALGTEATSAAVAARRARGWRRWCEGVRRHVACGIALRVTLACRVALRRWSELTLMLGWLRLCSAPATAMGRALPPSAEVADATEAAGAAAAGSLAAARRGLSRWRRFAAQRSADARWLRLCLTARAFRSWAVATRRAAAAAAAAAAALALIAAATRRGALLRGALRTWRHNGRARRRFGTASRALA